MANETDSVGKAAAKAGIGGVLGTLGRGLGKLLSDAITGGKQISGSKKSSDELDTGFEVKVSGIINRVLREKKGKIIMDEDGNAAVKFSDPSLEFILTGKDYKKKSADEDTEQPDDGAPPRKETK